MICENGKDTKKILLEKINENYNDMNDALEHYGSSCLIPLIRNYTDEIIKIIKQSNFN